jgi:hypothetical protein
MSSATPIRTVAFKADTIIDASMNVEVVQRFHTWLLGDDASSIAAVAADLKALADIIKAGLRDDLEIRTEATRLIRILERRAHRDFEGGLLDVDPSEIMALLYPDQYDELDEMTPIAMSGPCLAVRIVQTA